MIAFYGALERWEKYFPKGCRVVVWSDGSGHIEVKRVATSHKWHEVYAFERMSDFCGSNPEDYYPQLKPRYQ